MKKKEKDQWLPQGRKVGAQGVKLKKEINKYKCLVIK